MNDNERHIEEFVKGIPFETPNDKHRDVLKKQLLSAYPKHRLQSTVNAVLIRRTIMKSRTAKLTAAAVIAIVVVVGGIPFWPGGSDAGKWWLGPPAAWGQEILAELDALKGVTCREQTVFVMPDGSEHTSSTWNVLYVSRDSYRRDIYDGDVLRETQWYVPDGAGMLQHSVRFDLESYFTHTHAGSFGNYDPIDRMCVYVGLIDEADTLLGEDTIDGTACVGFEISASKYGNNPGDWIDCIWFDVETKLPVRMEKRGRPVTDYPDETSTTIQDEFDYNPYLPADTFVPETPEGFIFGHPDDIRAAREKERKD
ncbi:MAG: hypothetical protein CEE38_23680 [Planctomycetes bacterium B3_Pla]|nr:MAG: hypothetical protein CEE38_23680 [Planctomycetes bacterium B3_Pla]